jgi:phosphatidylglycerophosphatase A
LAVIVAYTAISLVVLRPVLRHSEVKDAPWIVVDEVAGQWLALLMAPRAWWAVTVAFVLFRLLDIAKPGPIGWLDRELSGGWGVMADDLLAGVVACAVLQLAVFGLDLSGALTPG